MYDSNKGELLALFDADWITTMRTGAVATLAAQTFRHTRSNYAFIGLGNTARATVLCLLDSEPNIHHKIKLLKYKNQAQLFIDRFENYKNVEFSIIDNVKDLIASSDVIISCVTEADGLFCDDNSLFRKGCVVIPVHTRGFQNCDLFFDKVFADDTAHVHGFKYFDKFKKFAEINDVIAKRIPGREFDEERILSYNIGLGLHDVVFATKLYSLLKDKAKEIEIKRETSKFWI